MAITKCLGGLDGTAAQRLDDFNRTDEVPLLDTAWGVPSGGNRPKLENNKIVGYGSPVNYVCYWSSDGTSYWLNDQWSEVQVGQADSGPVVRCRDTQQDYYCCWMSSVGGTSYRVVRVINGTPTDLATFATLPSNGTYVKLAVATDGSRNVLRLYYNDVQQGTDIIDDSASRITGGCPGFLVYGSDTIDNWSAGMGSVDYFELGPGSGTYGDTGTETVHVPADADVMLVCMDGYNAQSITFCDPAYATVTVDGNSQFFARAQGVNGPAWHAGIYAFDVRALRGQTVEVAYNWYLMDESVFPSRLAIAYYKGADATQVRDSDDCVHSPLGSWDLPALTTEPGDVVFVHNVCYQGQPTPTWTNATFISAKYWDTLVNSHTSVSQASATATGTSLSVSSDWSFNVDGDGTMIGVVLIPGGHAPRRLLHARFRS